MIFKRWFAPKWQHADAAIRQQALVDLSADNAEHKQILHELAFNDSSETVRRLALHQLNDFALWWQASKQDSAERLKHYAEQQVITALLDGSLAPAVKKQFVHECQRQSVLEQLVQQEQDAELSYQLLCRLDKIELTSAALLNDVLLPRHKQQLLAQISEPKLLEKLAKQLNAELSAQALTQLQHLQLQQQKPGQLRKQLTLLLAKLNALRERTPLAQLPAQLQQLDAQWQPLLAEFASFAAIESEQLQQKYQQLHSKLQQWLAPKLAEFAEQHAAEQQQQAAEQRYQLLKSALSDLRQQVQQLLLQHELSLTEPLTAELVSLRPQLDDSVLSASQQQTLLSAWLQLEQQLGVLPDLAEKMAQATQLLTSWQQVELPQAQAQLQEAKQHNQQRLQQWRELTRKLPLALPESLQQAFDELNNRWQQQLFQLEQAAKRQAQQCRSKLAEFQRLHAAGRFNVLFGLFKGISEQYQQLTEPEQQQLAKDYQQAQSQLAELTELQQYIATPRKQQLLAQMQQLQAEPLSGEDQAAAAEASARAKQVKLARQNWQSLGKADPELDQQLDAAFNQACEAAFEPCRAIFARQDAERAANVLEREQILQHLAELEQAALTDAKVLESRFQQLLSQWKGAGAVDRTHYQALQQRFKVLEQDIRQQLKALQQQVAQRKQQLIDEVQQALNLTDAQQQARVIKQCQQQWKTLGFAGKHQEQQLWTAFRALCDGFFSELKQQQQAQQASEQSAISAFNARFAELRQQLPALASVAEVELVLAKLAELPVAPNAECHQQVGQLQQQLQQRLNAQREAGQQQQARQALQQLFSQLEALAPVENWPQPYREHLSLQPALNRQQLTLALEMQSGVAVTAEDAPARQQVQLLLLSQKHNDGITPEPVLLFKQWLAHGAVTQAELPLLQRVKQLMLP
ncbi:DUF349 domain-containing protein [Arsukibacterium sp.]|uniref:DUF349 domain-containing protein n=1 Tax=Arsukibacterium sp. TaxID=1977258 RepID=UPI002FDAF59C